jgi:hypothetical protein
LGETFGQALVSTQNNKAEYEYPSATYNGGVHIALMGDPTLKIINKQALQSLALNYENDKPTSLTASPINGEKIYGYQLLLPDLSGEYEIVKSETFNEPSSDSFTIPIKDIVERGTYEPKEAILRPIVFIENYSGRFFFLGNGVQAE